MAPQTTIDEALLALARLLNQRNVPTSQSAAWQFFTTAAVQRLYRSFDFDPAKIRASITTDSNGQADLTALKFGQYPAITYIGTLTQPYGFITPDLFHAHAQGDYRWWLTRDPITAAWMLNSTEPGADIEIEYYEAVDLTGTQKAVFTPMVIAKGALIYYRQAEDPEADTGVEEDQFRQEVAEIIEQQNRNKPQQFFRSPRDVRGTHIGRR
jgi:hypothetical protein